MTDYTELKRAAERIVEVQTSQDVPIGILFDEFEALASPEAILAIIAENDALGGLLKRFVDGEHEQDENQAERHMYFTEAQSILALVNGELEAHTIVPDSAIKAIHAERDQLRAEIAGLRTGYEAYERVNAELKAENEALRKDAERYRRMRSAALKQADVLADEFDAEFDLQLDAALGKEVQS